MPLLEDEQSDRCQLRTEPILILQLSLDFRMIRWQLICAHSRLFCSVYEKGYGDLFSVEDADSISDSQLR